MFYWVNARTNTNELAAALRERGLVLAPGSLFSLEQAPSDWMRLNVTTPLDITDALIRPHFEPTRLRSEARVLKPLEEQPAR